jgi:hypothetical protein
LLREFEPRRLLHTIAMYRPLRLNNRMNDLRKWMRLVEAAGGVIDFRIADKTYEPTWGGPPQQFQVGFVLGKTKTLIFNIGNNRRGNERAWEIERSIKGLLPSPWEQGGLQYTHPTYVLSNGQLIMHWPRTYDRRGGDVTRYSDEVIGAAQQFIKRGLLPPDTKMFLRQSDFAYPLGTIAEVAVHSEQADLVLYHGTTLGRAVSILRDGLRPPEGVTTARQWKGNDVGWRDEAVYLTASARQAAVYATRALTNARKRKERGQKAVLLRVRIDPSMFDKLRPDDDYLAAMRDEAKDWRHSLGFYGQIALVGTIPPDHIEMTNITVKNRVASVQDTP